MNKRGLPVFLVASCLAASAAAQTPGSPSPPQTPTDVAKTDAPATAAPAPLVGYFEMGSSMIRNEDKAVLDHASRAYNEGKPIVVILTGTAERTGKAEEILVLSERRAAAVLKASSPAAFRRTDSRYWLRARRSYLSPQIRAWLSSKIGVSRSLGGDGRDEDRDDGLVAAILIAVVASSASAAELSGAPTPGPAKEEDSSAGADLV